MYIIIPAYEPDQRLVKVVADIKNQLPQAHIILINVEVALYIKIFMTIAKG